MYLLGSPLVCCRLSAGLEVRFGARQRILTLELRWEQAQGQDSDINPFRKSSYFADGRVVMTNEPRYLEDKIILQP